MEAGEVARSGQVTTHQRVSAFSSPTYGTAGHVEAASGQSAIAGSRTSAVMREPCPPNRCLGRQAPRAPFESGRVLIRRPWEMLKTWLRETPATSAIFAIE